MVNLFTLASKRSCSWCLSSALVTRLHAVSACSVIRALCSYGALDLYPGSINTRVPGIDNYSQLHIAMRRGDVRAMQLLLASGAVVNALDSYGNSALMYWPVAPSVPEELVLELAGELLAHVSGAQARVFFGRMCV